ncbi:MAG: hypothetical protein J6K15_02290 [Lachnospiraceae bacterium]|nr:hypothetical protein [Lachnospiraceae bacterium]
MADKNFIFSMKPYDVNTLFPQVVQILQKRVEIASRKKLPGLWKITDKLNAVPRAPETELKRRKERQRRWGGLLLVMGFFLFVPGVMKPQELPVPLVAGFLAIVLGMLYLRKGDRKKKTSEKKAKQLLEKLNASMEGQKLRLIFYDAELAITGVGDDKKISYANMECALETADLFGLIYENQIVLLQKKELLLGNAEDLIKALKEKTTYEKI